jgi:2-oxoglutarate ferredoxin oxidoreductase subunit gamma
VPNSSVLKVRLAGTGGQGIIKASIILATAVVLDGRRVVQSQSYGPEARGGSCKADVIVSDEDILYPRIDRPNVLLCLSEAAYAKYLPGIADDAVVILNESLSSATNSGSRAYKVPITTIAREKLGAEITSLNKLSYTSNIACFLTISFCLRTAHLLFVTSMCNYG